MSIGLGDFLKLAQEKFPAIPWDKIVPIVLIIVLFISIGIPFWKNAVLPAWKFIANIINKRKFLRETVHKELSYMEWKDVEYALNQYIPTRYSGNDPGYADEPVPEELVVEKGKTIEPLLIEHFLNYEFDVHYNGKFYLCLADCGMGKTTFLVNLYYRMLREKKHPCKFVFLCEENCMKKIEAIKNRANTILLLDALDENNQAQNDFQKFITELERETKDFYKVVITSRTNFFETAAKERLSGQIKSGGTSQKISTCKKYYIAPFTDDDIKKLLKARFRFMPKKYKEALVFIEKHKNLSVRPMLLHYIEELVAEGVSYDYDFQLYEALFKCWVEREVGSIREERGKEFYNECVFLAKQIYYQWMKTGSAGIQVSELEKNDAIQQLKSIQFRGHALLNRTSNGVYKFSHKSFWEYMLAKLAMSDLYFANELMLNNTVDSFDRASAFVEEMIKYELKNGWKSPQAAAGAGIYTLCCKKPEDAEKLFEIALKEQFSRENLLLIKLKLGRSYWYQLKEKSTLKILDAVQPELEQMKLTEERLPLYTEFGSLLASYSHRAKIKRGEQFIKFVIDFCCENKLFSYDFYRCCEAFCHCCGSLKEKDDTIHVMKNTLGSDRDEYIEYLITNAESWGLLFDEDNEQMTSLLAKQTEKYTRFMDAYNLIFTYGDNGVALYSKYAWSDEFGEKQDYLIEELGKGYDICCAVFEEMEDTDTDIVINAYQAILYRNVYRALNKISERVGIAEPQRKRVEEIERYIIQKGMEEEAQFFYTQLLDFVRDTGNMEENYIKQCLDKALHLAKGSAYWTCWVCWSLFSEYDSGNSDSGKAQEFLKKGYEAMVRDGDVQINAAYCNFLRVVLGWYKGSDIDKAEIAEKLYELTPKVFGISKRQIHIWIYEKLSEYYKEIRDKRWLESQKKILELRFTSENIGELYAVAKEMTDDADQYLLEVVYGKAEWNNEDVSALEKYIYPEKDKRFDESSAPSEALKQNLEAYLRTLRAMWNKKQVVAV